MLYTARTTDGKYRLDVRALNTNGNSYELVLVPSNPLQDSAINPLEVFDDAALAKTAAIHFLDCYQIAIEQGYHLLNETFVHPAGRKVSVAAAFAIDDTGDLLDVGEFQKELHMAQTLN
ncbi:hypothetical protein D2Q93_03420 [Alicyclobacillaceae bacterium I2511]|nr:hypothetical protein D2Q93_03420 [Alicyclobacillaceae bacterium I2511]